MGAKAEHIGRVAQGELLRLPLELDAAEACAEDGQSLAGRWIQVLPFGQQIEARDGRKFTVQDAHEIIKCTELPMLVDWEHRSVADDSAAAGWIEELEVREGKGVWGRVDWTPRGREQVKAKEFRFLSPVVLGKRDAGLFHVRRLASVALTNTPALKMAGIEMFREQLSHRYGAFIEDAPAMSTKLKTALLTALGLGADTSDEQLESAALARLKPSGGSDDVATLKQITATLTAERNEALEKLKAQTTELATFKATAFKSDVEAFFDKGGREGKIPPAAREKWLKFALEGADKFEMFKEVVYPGLPKVVSSERQAPREGKESRSKLRGKGESGVDYDALKAIGLSDKQIRESEAEVFNLSRGPGDEDEDEDDESDPVPSENDRGDRRGTPAQEGG